MLTKTDLKEIEKIVKPLEKGLAEVKANLKEVTETTNSNAGSLMKIENTIGAYSDALDIERKRIDGHDTRLTKVEETLTI